VFAVSGDIQRSRNSVDGVFVCMNNLLDKLLTTADRNVVFLTDDDLKPDQMYVMESKGEDYFIAKTPESAFDRIEYLRGGELLEKSINYFGTYRCVWRDDMGETFVFKLIPSEVY
jgi:hypothetical protein